VRISPRLGGGGSPVMMALQSKSLNRCVWATTVFLGHVVKILA
jgi:hypothetical protein